MLGVQILLPLNVMLKSVLAPNPVRTHELKSVHSSSTAHLTPCLSQRKPRDERSLRVSQSKGSNIRISVSRAPFAQQKQSVLKPVTHRGISKELTKVELTSKHLCPEI